MVHQGYAGHEGHVGHQVEYFYKIKIVVLQDLPVLCGTVFSVLQDLKYMLIWIEGIAPRTTGFGDW